MQTLVGGSPTRLWSTASLLTHLTWCGNAAGAGRSPIGTAAAPWVNHDITPVVAHGCRSTFTDWVADNEVASVEAAEAALAHEPESDTRKAYRRNDLLNARRPLMQKWEDYILPPERS